MPPLTAPLNGGGVPRFACLVMVLPVPIEPPLARFPRLRPPRALLISAPNDGDTHVVVRGDIALHDFHERTR